MSARYVYMSALMLGYRAAAFNLYPTVDPDSLADSLGISVRCLDALNTTVNCDQDVFQWTHTVDNYLWSTDNITTLCTSTCTQSAQQWNDNVKAACSDDSITLYGKFIPADSIAGRAFDGLNLACLQSSDASTWCMIESQSWVGSDVVRPDCSTDPSDPSCTDPTNVTADNERIANLYNDTVLCSGCFLTMFHERLTSSYLPDSDYSDYLIEQFQDIQDVCTSTLSAMTIRALPTYDPAPTPTPYIDPNWGTDICVGQTIGIDQNGQSCIQLSQKFSVTTGDLKAATGDDNCTISNPICVPAACTLQQVPANATCDSLASSFSTSSLGVSTHQLLTWNYNIIGLCDLLQEGQYVCASAPGGSYVPPPAPTGDANAGGQERGGAGGADPTGISGTPTSYLVTSNPLGNLGPTAAPAPTQDGIVSNCNTYAMAVKGDYCQEFATNNSITTDQLYAWNAILANGANCTSQLFANYYYCVGIPGSASTTTTSNTANPTTTTAAAPSPTQSGISPYCSKYNITVSGDYCAKFAQDNNIPTADLYTWNTVLGSGGSNCDTQLFLGYYYCIAIAPPTPTQSGIAPNCNNYTEAISGDYCSKFAQENNITTDNLYAWNTVLGTGGSNCNSAFFANYYYCVSVSS